MLWCRTMGPADVSWDRWFRGAHSSKNQKRWIWVWLAIMQALFLSPKEYAKTVSKRATRGPTLSGAFFFFFFLIINLKLLYGLGVVEKMLGTFSLAMLIGKAYQNHSLNYYAIFGHLVSKMCLYINSINHYVSQHFF